MTESSSLLASTLELQQMIYFNLLSLQQFRTKLPNTEPLRDLIVQDKAPLFSLFDMQSGQIFGSHTQILAYTLWSVDPNL